MLILNDFTNLFVEFDTNFHIWNALFLKQKKYYIQNIH